MKTPMRMATALLSCTSGYAEDARSIVGDALFDCESTEPVLVRGIDFFSLCEHHMLPFFGKAHVAYVPAGRVVGARRRGVRGVRAPGRQLHAAWRSVAPPPHQLTTAPPFRPGLSKLARIVDIFAKRLQIQERLTGQIAAAVAETVGASGVAVMLECT